MVRLKNLFIFATLVCLSSVAFAADASSLVQGQAALRTETGSETAEANRPRGQFMAWSNGYCVTLRYAVLSHGCPFFRKAMPQGINERILLVNYTTHPISGPMQVFVGEVTFNDHRYESIDIPDFPAQVRILRNTDPPQYAQAMAYVQCGSLVTQTIDPGCSVACLQLCSFHPLKYRKIVGSCWHCCCCAPTIKQGAVRDDGHTSEIIVEDPILHASMLVPVLR